MNAELKKVVSRLKAAQASIQSREWIEEVRSFANTQGKEIQKLLKSDIDKIRSFVERERSELERLQRQIPGEVEKFRKLVDGQRKELEALLKRLKRHSAPKKKPAKRAKAAKKSARKSVSKSKSHA